MRLPFGPADADNEVRLQFNFQWYRRYAKVFYKVLYETGWKDACCGTPTDNSDQPGQYG